MNLIDKEFYIQNLPVTQICEQFGTPLYVYNAEKIKEQLQRFRRAFGAGTEVKYAAKALTNLSILKLMRSLGTGLDTVSPAEIRMGLEAGFLPEQIVFTPNAVDFSEIREAVNFGVKINIENLSNLEKFGREYGPSGACCLRLNPHIAAQTAALEVEAWHRQSKFGISAGDLEEVRRLQKKYNFRIEGIHIHSSSVIMSPEVFERGVRAVFKIAETFPGLQYLDFGGGIKTDVGDGKPVVNLEEIGAVMQKLFAEFCAAYGSRPQLWFEPGRFLVMPAGTLFTQCKVRKSNGSVDFIGTDSGFAHLIRPMFYGAWHSIENINNPVGEKKMYNVVGNICEIDNFATDRELPETKEGDILAIRDAGAYGFMMASNYNSRPRPAEVLVMNGKAHLIRRADSYEDFIRNQVVLEDALFN